MLYHFYPLVVSLLYYYFCHRLVNLSFAKLRQLRMNIDVHHQQYLQEQTSYRSWGVSWACFRFFSEFYACPVKVGFNLRWILPLFKSLTIKYNFYFGSQYMLRFILYFVCVFCIADIWFDCFRWQLYVCIISATSFVDIILIWIICFLLTTDCAITNYYVCMQFVLIIILIFDILYSFIHTYIQY